MDKGKKFGGNFIRDNHNFKNGSNKNFSTCLVHLITYCEHLLKAILFCITFNKEFHCKDELLLFIQSLFLDSLLNLI